MISYDNCAISYENCAIIIKETSRVGDIFRVGRVTPTQPFFFGLSMLHSASLIDRLENSIQLQMWLPDACDNITLNYKQDIV